MGGINILSIFMCIACITELTLLIEIQNITAIQMESQTCKDLSRSHPQSKTILIAESQAKEAWTSPSHHITDAQAKEEWASPSHLITELQAKETWTSLSQHVSEAHTSSHTITETRAQNQSWKEGNMIEWKSEELLATPSHLITDHTRKYFWHPKGDTLSKPRVGVSAQNCMSMVTKTRT